MSSRPKGALERTRRRVSKLRAQEVFEFRGDAAELIAKWSSLIQRRAAARAAQFGNRVSSDELAQQALIDICCIPASLADPPDAYINAVISTSFARVLRQERRRLDAQDIEYVNAILENAARRGRRDEFNALIVPAVDAVTDEESDDVNAVRTWVEGLNPQMKRVVKLLYVDGLTEREAARELGVSQPRINYVRKAMIARGRSELSALRAAA